MNFPALKNTKKLFLVSPSMSGVISLPYLFNPSNGLAGFVAVAPVGGPDPANTANFKKVKTPTLIVFGENDRNLGVKGAQNMANIPDHEQVMVPNGKHPCYLDDPELWHRSLIQFVKSH